MDKRHSPHKLHRTSYALERSGQIQRARELRNNPTRAEELLWSKLRKRQLKGRKFRRQCPLGAYFPDFVCLSERLIIELDGAHHAEPEQARHDRIRTIWLRGQDFRVMRFLNGEVQLEMPRVLAEIEQAFVGPHISPPHP
jgi:very-short-patch-repair endonuclease